MLLPLLLCCGLYAASATPVTIYNNASRVDVNGNIIDCHSGLSLGHIVLCLCSLLTSTAGNIVKFGDTFFMYGEYYGNSTGFDTNNAPTLSCYTSPNMVDWVCG